MNLYFLILLLKITEYFKIKSACRCAIIVIFSKIDYAIFVQFLSDLISGTLNTQDFRLCYKIKKYLFLRIQQVNQFFLLSEQKFDFLYTKCIKHQFYTNLRLISEPNDLCRSCLIHFLSKLSKIVNLCYVYLDFEHLVHFIINFCHVPYKLAFFLPEAVFTVFMT